MPPSSDIITPADPISRPNHVIADTSKAAHFDPESADHSKLSLIQVKEHPSNLRFTLPRIASTSIVTSKRIRATLAAAGVADGVDPDAWVEGFRCELKVQAINRVGIQRLFAAEFSLAYLARANTNIERFLDLYG